VKVQPAGKSLANGNNGGRGPLKARIHIPFFMIKRNVARSNKWALGLIIFLMAVAFINLIFINSLFGGVVASNNDQLINTTTGNITVEPQSRGGYIDAAEVEAARIRRVEGVKATTAQTNAPGSLELGGQVNNLSLVGMVPSQEKQVTTIWKHMIKGSYLKDGDSDGIMIGQDVLGSSDTVGQGSVFTSLKPGDRVTVVLQDARKVMTVRGIFQTKFARADGRAYITKQAMNELQPSTIGKATSILVKTVTTGNEDQVVAAMQAAGIRGNFITWQQAATGMKEVTNSFVTINALLTAVGFVIAAVTIFIIIYVDITHKRQEIGIMRALGVRPYLIATTYVLQAGVYSLCGVLVGSALFFGILVPYFKVHPFSIPIGDVTLAVQPADFLVRAILVVIVGLISGVIPAIISNRKPILDSILGR
jgi:putative ABC transport system permease protein